MSSPIRLIELGFVEHLKTVPRGFKLPVESYAAQLDDELFAWVRALPAVWVTFGQLSEYKRVGAHSFKATANFEVLCAQRSLTESDRRLNDDDSASVGVYELLEQNKLALINQKLGLPIEPITPGAIRPVMKSMVNREPISVYAQEFHTSWMEVVPDALAVPLGELVTVGVNYFIKPQHSAGTDAPDATDKITLEPRA